MISTKVLCSSCIDDLELDSNLFSMRLILNFIRFLKVKMKSQDQFF